MRRLKCKNIKRFKRFKPQAFQASSFKADPDFHQDDTFVRACPEFNSGMTGLRDGYRNNFVRRLADNLKVKGFVLLLNFNLKF